MPSHAAIEQLLRDGLSLQRQGMLDPAAERFRAILDRKPDHFEAAYSLGLIALQTGDAGAAAAWLQRALAVRPVDPNVHALLAIALQTGGKPGAALTHFRESARLDPANPGHHYNLAKALREHGRLGEAVAAYEAALRLHPDYPEALSNLAELLILLERPEEALSRAERALQLRPAYPEALSNKGGALLALGRPQDALQTLDLALHAKPGMPRAQCNRAQALGRLRRPDEALACIDRLLETHPDHGDALHARGQLFSELRRLPEAVADFDRVLAGNPANPLALLARGSALFHLDRYQAAEEDIEAAIRIGGMPPDATARAHLSLATLHLLQGRFDKGWAEFPWRWSTREFSAGLPAFSKPAWDGKPTGGHVLVWQEQGLGEQLLFSSMLGDAAALCGKLGVAVDERLHPLLGRSFPGLCFTTLEAAGKQQDFDCHLALGDLGTFLRRSPADCLLSRRAFLRADARRAAELRRDLQRDDPRPVCGLSWSSRHDTVGDRKSLSLARLAPALGGAHCQFVDLQYGDTAAERAHLAATTGIGITRVASIDNHRDLDGLAALIEACDVIVTISNTTAHLAGALGKTVFLMLPHSIGRFWYWQSERSDSLWYPGMRIFRQSTDGDWSPVIGEVAAALMNLSAGFPQAPASGG